MLEITLKNCEWKDVDIEVSYSSQGIENITVAGREPKGREIDMIHASLQEIQEAVCWQIYQDKKESEYDNRIFAGRTYA